MTYGNYMYQPGFQMPMQSQMQSQQFNQQIKSEVIHVNGKNGADALVLAPNSSIFLADDTKQDRIWLCMTDGAGYKTVKAFITTPEEDLEQANQEAAQAAMISFEERLKKVEEFINEQFNTRNTEPVKAVSDEKQYLAVTPKNQYVTEYHQS